MSNLVPSISSHKSADKIGHGAVRGESRSQSSHSASIHILDDDSLLTIFYLYRPVIVDPHTKGQEVDYWYSDGGRVWDLERWWYKLAQVCQRWRSLILGSPSYLGLCLLCTNGTPVADMLAHSPPLPLVIDYHLPDSPDLNISAEEKVGIILALERRDRVCRIRFRILVPNLRNLTMSIDEEYPLLEYLIITPPVDDMSPALTALTLPETLQAPRLRHLELSLFALPMRSQLFPADVGLVTLTLTMGHPPTYFRPNVVLRWLSFMPQLERLSISMLYPEDVESQVLHAPSMPHVTPPNLHWFNFHGDSAFEEALVCRMTTPHLERLRISFFEQPTFSVPSLLQFMKTTRLSRHLKLKRVKVAFDSGQMFVGVNYLEDSAGYLSIAVVHDPPLNLQVSSMVQIFDSIDQIFSMVEELAFEYNDFYELEEEQNVFDRTEWRRLLTPFNNVKTLHIDEELVEGLSHILRVVDGEDPLEVLPELLELTYFGSNETGEAFASFIDARQNVGLPVTLVTLGPVCRPRSVATLSRSASQSSLDSSIITWNCEVVEADSGLDS